MKDSISGCEICTVNNITDAEEFVEQWMAYSLTNFNGAEPTVARLNEFQLKGYQSREPAITSNDDYRPMPSKRSRASNANSILSTYGFNDTVQDKVRSWLSCFHYSSNYLVRKRRIYLSRRKHTHTYMALGVLLYSGHSIQGSAKVKMDVIRTLITRYVAEFPRYPTFQSVGVFCVASDSWIGVGRSRIL